MGSARVVVGQEGRAIRDFSERLCTRYTLSIRAQAGNYRERLNALLADAQLPG